MDACTLNMLDYLCISGTAAQLENDEANVRQPSLPKAALLINYLMEAHTFLVTALSELLSEPPPLRPGIVHEISWCTKQHKHLSRRLVLAKRMFAEAKNCLRIRQEIKTAQRRRRQRHQ